MTVLIVDDDNDKIVKLMKVILEIYGSCQIEVVEDFVSARRSLSQAKFDFLILDLLLPVRKGENPSFEVSKNLLHEISRKAAINPPRWILGISQHIEAGFSMSMIWPTVKYDPTNNEWEVCLTEYVQHILNFEDRSSVIEQPKPHIFVEGLSDKKILERAFLLFRPEVLTELAIVGEKQAGSNWVARKIIVWAHSLFKDKDGNFIRAIGLLDNDSAGLEAKKEINRVILGDSAHALTNKIFSLSIGYARHLISLKEKGLLIPVSLEEMYQPTAWRVALERNWLELRTRPEQLLRDKSAWNGYDISLKDYLIGLGLDDNESLYLNITKMFNKEDFANYVVSLSEGEQREVLSCFKKLVDDCCDYLFKLS